MSTLFVATVLTLSSFNPAILRDQDQDLTAIRSYIANQARRERGEEYEDARKIIAGDLNGDGSPETVVLYTIEGQRGSNNYIQYVAVFERRKGQLAPIAHTAVGGKSYRSIELNSVDKQRVNLDTLSYGPKDASCCPSIEGTTSYALVGRTLREQKPPANPARQK
jgi:hypothetical protein